MINLNTSVYSIIRDSDLNLLDIKLLISLVTGLTRIELITKSDYQLTSSELEYLDQLVQRRTKGEPLNYILGYKEFYSRGFKVNSDTLIPRPETEILVDKALALSSNKQRSFLDLGTGSGCIAITCKLENPKLNVIASDKYAGALSVACENATKLGADIKFILSDWFENINGMFDIIVSNPPYIAVTDWHLDSLTYEPITALTDNYDGLSAISHIVNYSCNFLSSGGYLIFEHGHTQADISHQLLEKAGFMNIETIKDYAGLDRVTLGQYNK